MMYTQVPLEQVFEGFEEMKKDTFETVISGVLMEVRPVQPRHVQIVRLLSPNPQHYLNPAWAPGQMIELGAMSAN